MKNTIDAKIFYSEKTKLYLMLRQHNLQCSRCTKALKEYAIVVQTQTILEPMKTEMLCNGCLLEGITNHGITMIITCIIASEIPDSYFRIHFSPITLVNSNMDNMTLASTNVGGEEVIDKTRHCHNPDFMRMPEYDPKHIEKMQSRIMELDNKATDDFFDKTISAQPVFDDKQIEEKKKQLEAK